ncbi:hypothetical protein TNCV_3173631 [Trichonephila clavipes]|nr:hypothetical protein TNCV_3173631 [Trichonephila clavipes]
MPTRRTSGASQLPMTRGLRMSESLMKQRRGFGMYGRILKLRYPALIEVHLTASLKSFIVVATYLRDVTEAKVQTQGTRLLDAHIRSIFLLPCKQHS